MFAVKQLATVMTVLSRVKPQFITRSVFWLAKDRWYVDVSLLSYSHCDDYIIMSKAPVYYENFTGTLEIYLGLYFLFGSNNLCVWMINITRNHYQFIKNQYHKTVNEDVWIKQLDISWVYFGLESPHIINK